MRYKDQVFFQYPYKIICKNYAYYQGYKYPLYFCLVITLEIYNLFSK